VTFADIEALRAEGLEAGIAGLTLSFNDHATSYETAEQWWAGLASSDLANDDEWASPEEKALALAGNSVWELQWYPHTPVGFCRIYASSLPALLAAVQRIRDEG
jgi:hypothetical protein